MAKDPIVFAMANPNPEITYPDAVAARKDVIMATGRSDYPNQVNNVLGFPFIFRGALDCRATTINEEMKLAAAHALADLAKEDVPDKVSRAYQDQVFHFGREYLIPKPFDYRVLLWEAAAVAQGGHGDGSREEARWTSRSTLSPRETARPQPRVDARHHQPRASELRSGSSTPKGRTTGSSARSVDGPGGEARPAGPGRTARADQGDLREALVSRWANTEIVDIEHDPRLESYVEEYYRLRHRKGITMDGARTAMKNPNVFAAMMVHKGDADGMVSGIAHRYSETIRPALQIINMREGVKQSQRVGGAGRPQSRLLLRGSGGQHQPDGGGAGGDRPPRGGGRPGVRLRAEDRDALVLELRDGRRRSDARRSARLSRSCTRRIRD